VQDLLQRMLEEEVAAMLGRRRYARREGVDAAPGYRNGYGKPRRLSVSVGTVTLRRPRVRGLAERFESQLLPLFKRRTEAVGQLLPRLYLHGLALGDFDLALRGLLGDGAPLSAASVARLKAGWQAEYELWRTRSLAELEPVILWVDGIYVKAGLEKDKAAMLVVLAGLRDGRKVILAVESGHRESTESWRAVLRDLQRRGLSAPRVVVGDGHLGIWGALPAVFPGAAEQRCWNHRLLNLLDKVPTRLQAEAKSLLTKIPYAETREGAERQKRAFQTWATKKGVAAVGQALDHDWDRLVTFYQFPTAHWKHLRTTDESVKGVQKPALWRYTPGRGTGDPVRRAGRAAESPAAQVVLRAHQRRAALVAPVPRFGRWGRQWVTSVWYARSACSPIARSRVRSVLRLYA
jgi:transposase-like protein